MTELIVDAIFEDIALVHRTDDKFDCKLCINKGTEDCNRSQPASCSKYHLGGYFVKKTDEHVVQLAKRRVIGGD